MTALTMAFLAITGNLMMIADGQENSTSSTLSPSSANWLEESATLQDVASLRGDVQRLRIYIETVFGDELTNVINPMGDAIDVGIENINATLNDLKKQVANHTVTLLGNNSGTATPTVNEILNIVENKTAAVISILSEQIKESKSQFVELLENKPCNCQGISEDSLADLRAYDVKTSTDQTNQTESNREMKTILHQIQNNVTYIQDLEDFMEKERSVQSCSRNLDMPTNCDDLWCLGHETNGFYSVKGMQNKNGIETIHCKFNVSQPTRSQLSVIPKHDEKRIGFVDVKSSPVHFYVQRRSLYILSGTVIPYEIERLNIGGAMDLKTGTFTAPTNGTYRFAFSALRWVEGYKKEIQTGTGIRLRLNGVFVCGTYGTEENWIATIGFHSTLKLMAGDKIDVLLRFGGIYDTEQNQWTQFTGSLLEEDLKIN